MTLRDDPAVLAAEVRHARRSMTRTAAIWTPLFVASAAGMLFFLIDLLLGGDRGTWFLVGVLALFTLLFGFQGLQSLWDLWSEPCETEGEVTRRWSRNDSIVMRSHYIRLDNRKIFRIDRALHGDPRTADRVKVHHYPHSMTVVRVELLAKPEEAPAGEEPAAGPVVTDESAGTDASKPRARDTDRPEMPNFG